jgi:RNA polymerase sigma-70 factor (ECF subfamily)
LKLLTFRPPSSERSPENCEHAVGRLLLENLDSLYSTAHRLTGRADLAEDLVQETARKALRAAAALADHRNIRAWLFTILVNAVRDHLRHSQRWEEIELSDEALPPPDLESLSLATSEDIRRALDRLTGAQRAVVILVDIEEFTISETAQMLKLPPGTVASRLARAHAVLRGFLRGYSSRPSEIGGRP